MAPQGTDYHPDSPWPTFHEIVGADLRRRLRAAGFSVSRTDNIALKQSRILLLAHELDKHDPEATQRIFSHSLKEAGSIIRGLRESQGS